MLVVLVESNAIGLGPFILCYDYRALGECQTIYEYHLFMIKRNVYGILLWAHDGPLPSFKNLVALGQSWTQL